MKVAMDARWIIPSPSGIGVYTRELLRRLPGVAPDLEFLVIFRDAALRDAVMGMPELGAAPNLKSVTVPYGTFSLRGQWRLPGWLRRHGVDLFHTPNYMMPFAAFPRDRRGRIRSVVNVHDVIPFVLPDHAPKSRKNRLWPLFVRCMRETLARADAIVTGSETSRRDMVDALRLTPRRAARTRVVVNGVNPIFHSGGNRPPRATDAPRTILYVGRMDPYKNLPLLVRSFVRLRECVPFPLRLRVIGPEDPRYPDARDIARVLGVAEAIEFRGYVSDAELADEYRAADVLAHPSRYEGFGLQVAEAMRSGLPVVCSDGGSLPEVAGDAALVVPRDDAGALTDALSRVLTDAALAAHLRTRGIERARRYSWHVTAEETLSIYRELLENGA